MGILTSDGRYSYRALVHARPNVATHEGGRVKSGTHRSSNIGDRREEPSRDPHHWIPWLVVVLVGVLAVVAILVAGNVSMWVEGSPFPSDSATATEPAETRWSTAQTTFSTPGRVASTPTGSDATHDVAAAVKHLADLIHEVLAAREEIGRYSSDCTLSPAECLHQLSRGLFMALDRVVLPSFINGEISFAWLLERHGSDVVEALLAQTVATSTDAVNRVAALAIMEHLEGLPVRELPVGAYESLTERPAAEVALLLRRHEDVPLTREHVAAEIEGMVADASLHEHYRYAAAEALGHPATSDRLNHLVGSLVAEERLQPDLGRRLEVAITRCGTSCAASIEALVGSSNPDLRAMAYSVLPRIRTNNPADRQELLWRVAALAPHPGEMDATERESWERTTALLER